MMIKIHITLSFIVDNCAIIICYEVMLLMFICTFKYIHGESVSFVFNSLVVAKE